MALRTILLSLPLLSSLIACTITPPAGELTSGHLRPCPNRPNCVTSDGGTTDSIEPIVFSGSPEEAWQRIQTVIQELGGQIRERKTTYLWATFTSRFFRFVDDVELRMEPEQNRIQIRSGSRIGYSDFGVNRKRVEKIRQDFADRTPAKAGPSNSK